MAPCAFAADGPDGDGDRAGDGQTEREAVSTVQRVVVVASVALTISLFAFVAWNAVDDTGDARPSMTLERVGTTEDGRTLHSVTLANPSDRGLERATVVVSCGDPPREVTLEHVPPQGEQMATVACPPGTDDPPASVTSWITA